MYEQQAINSSDVCCAKDHVRYAVARAARFSSIASGSSVVSVIVICVSGKRGLFLDSEGGRGMIGGETFASCKRGVFANGERPARVRNRFSMTLSRSEGGSSEKETKVRSNCASSPSWRRS